MHGPVGGIDKAQSSDDHEDPHDEVKAVENVIENNGFLYSYGENQRHHYGDSKADEVRIGLSCCKIVSRLLAKL